MARFAIDRKNRDRKGGHECTPIRKGPWAGADMKVARSIIKRYDKRLLRRQHNKAIAEGIAAYHQELNEHCAWVADLYGDFQEGAEDYQEYLYGYDEPEPFDDYDYDDYPILDDYDSGPYNGLDTCDDPICIQCAEERNYRPRSHARIQDQIVAEQLTDEVRRGMVSLDLEVIENRDAGKSLGQLLRERLSRPF